MTSVARSSRFKVVLHGSYFTDNFGDILLMQIYLGWLREAVDGVEVLMPFLPDTTSHHFDVPSDRGYGSLRGVDTFVFGGGGYFGEPPSEQRRWGTRLAVRHLTPGLLASMKGCEVVVNGVGAGPVSANFPRWMLAKVVRTASQVVVRDEESVAFMLGLGVSDERLYLGSDAALSLSPKELPAAAVAEVDEWLAGLPSGPRLGVHFTGDSRRGGGHAVAIDDVLAFAASRPDLRVVAITDQQGAAGQVAAVEELSERLAGRCDIYHYQRPWSLAALLARLDLVVTMKLHVGIVAAVLGTPVISVRSHPKIERFYRQLGADDASVPLSDLKSGTLSMLLQSRLDRPEGIIVVPEALRAAAQKCRELLQERLQYRASQSRDEGWG